MGFPKREMCRGAGGARHSIRQLSRSLLKEDGAVEGTGPAHGGPIEAVVASRSAKTLPPQRSVLWPWCHGSQCSSASLFIIYYYNTLNIILMIHNTLISKIDVAVCGLRRVSPSCDYRAMYRSTCTQLHRALKA